MDESELRRRVASSPVARLATVRADGTPHVVPVCFAVDGDRIVSVVDHKPKATTALRRLDNVARASGRQSPRRPLRRRLGAALVGARRRHRAVRDAGPEHESAIDLLVAKYAQYRDVRPTGSVLEITAVRWLRMVGGMTAPI